MIPCDGVIAATSRTVIDTLRFADCLKDSGFESRQAEGMARALADESAEHVVTKSVLDAELGKVRSDITVLRARVDVLGAKVDALGAKVDTLGAQVKFVLAALAVLMALGLIETVPRLLT